MWITHGSKPLLTTGYLSVHRARVTSPGGAVMDYDHIAVADTVRVVVIVQDRVALVSQGHYLPGQRLLQLPGGAVDAGETPAQAARREVAEETGFTGGRWAELGTVWPAPAILRHRAHLFALEDPSPGPAAPQPGEADLKVVWLPLEPGLVLRVGCAASVAALSRALAGPAGQDRVHRHP